MTAPAEGVAEAPAEAPAATPADQPGRPALVWLLRLRHLRLAGWQRFLLGDLPIVIASLLVLADVASAWLLVALPVAVAAMVKLHDVVAGRLADLRGEAGPAPYPEGESAA